MAIIETWCPPSQQHWNYVVFIWQFFPIITILQWFIQWYPAGKTSNDSKLNLPGKFAWITMEAPGFMLLLYLMTHLPGQQGLSELPLMNWIMAGMFTTHYVYRSIISPLLNPSMSPIHVVVWMGALTFQIINATSIGGYLAGYGPIHASEWYGNSIRIEVGMIVFAIGLLSNIYHDDELREIRRAANRSQNQRNHEKRNDEAKSDATVRVYAIPQNGLFHLVLYPHYLTEWIEWAGFWMVGGWDCVPARIFLINEIATMLPRALQGKRWYEHRFGREKLRGKKAIIPWLI